MGFTHCLPGSPEFDYSSCPWPAAPIISHPVVRRMGTSRAGKPREPARTGQRSWWQSWWHHHLPNTAAELLFSTDPMCCCSAVGIRGQERHLFKAVLSLKPPFHQTLAQEYKKIILCCCLVLAKIQTLLSEKLCVPASHFLSFLSFRHLFIIQNQKPGDEFILYRMQRNVWIFSISRSSTQQRRNICQLLIFPHSIYIWILSVCDSYFTSPPWHFIRQKNGKLWPHWRQGEFGYRFPWKSNFKQRAGSLHKPVPRLSPSSHSPFIFLSSSSRSSSEILPRISNRLERCEPWC